MVQNLELIKTADFTGELPVSNISGETSATIAEKPNALTNGDMPFPLQVSSTIAIAGLFVVVGNIIKGHK